METDRLLLREMTHDDVDALHAVLGDPVAMRYYPRPFDPAEVKTWIERQIGLYRERGFGLWGVVLKESGEVIGDCGLTPQLPLGEEEIEVGWHIARAHQRRGYASEAARACRDWAFANLDVAGLVSMIRPENVPSQGVARNIGMAPQEHFDYKGTPHVLWRLARPEL